MATVVIEPPMPFVAPADIAGSHSENDDAVAAMIEAVTEDIDGPSGWLGRCLGPQVLEQQQCDFSDLRIRFPPVIEIVSIEFVDRKGVVWFIPPENYRLVRSSVQPEIRGAPSFNWPTDLSPDPDAVRIRFKAGYDGSDGIGEIPKRARQAVILATQQMLSTFGPSANVRSEDVEGVGTTQYLDADKVAAVVQVATESLLSTLRIPR
ncbi:hypothetical protein [Brucella rhizosphaerae]|uniref:Uncharacterized protein n=1 Tax=Brucella rhizosphaerae TaxID=571254 RepID=A0A256FPE6_9HYPH|nr:hypothetical protein [Brucella rhizosphaerae]OYR16722.1 hypothetical protein CEV32_4356 [Brucella rhizosphaerae]